MSLQLFTISFSGFTERGIEAGDIVNYKLWGKPWGKQVCNRYLLMNVYMDEEELRTLKEPYYDGGVTLKEINETHASQLKAIEGTVLTLPTIPKLPEVINPFRFGFHLEDLRDGWYPDLKIDDVLNLNKPYQPFLFDDVRVDTNEKVAIFFDKFRQSYKYSSKRKI